MVSHRWISLVVILSLYLPQTSAFAQEVAALSRPVALVNLKGTSDDAVAALLNQARIPGGIVSLYAGCVKPREHTFSLQDGTLQRGLDYILTIDDSRRWTQRDGVILVGFQLTGKTILSTIIRELYVNPNDPLSLSVQRLLASREVRESVEKAGLIEMSPELGFSSIAKPGATALEESRAQQTMYFHEITVEQTLNALASKNRTAVWHYEQFVCGGKSSFRLSWAISPR